MRPYLQLLLSIPALLLASCAGGTSSDTEAVTLQARLADEQSTLEEDYQYPGAADYLKLGITLKSGDGNLLLVDCNTTGYSLRVESFVDSFCFKVRGQSAYLTLELPEVFLVQTTIAGATAKVLSNGQFTTVPLVQGEHTPLVQLPGGETVYPTLVELRLST